MAKLITSKGDTTVYWEKFWIMCFICDDLSNQWGDIRNPVTTVNNDNLSCCDNCKGALQSLIKNPNNK
jgi:hypothetical protein